MGIMLIKTIMLGIVEGLTEFIPVSSTAHLLITERILHIAVTPFITVLTVVIQSGAMLAALIFFWKTVWKHLSLIPKVIVAFLPTVVVGLFAAQALSALFSASIVIALALIIGGIIFVILKPIDSTDRSIAASPKDSAKTITYKESFIIGLSQIFAIIPGVSRSGATLIGGTLAKIPRELIVSFSFILAIPTIFGASAIELRHLPALTHSEIGLIVVGTVVAFIVALATMRFMLRALTKKPLRVFGWYRILIGILFLILVL